jgi:methyl-accepting chemotaxis protein
MGEWFNNLKVNTKFTVVIAVVLAVTILASIVGIQATTELKRSADVITNGHLRIIYHLGEAKAALYRMSNAERNLYLAANPGDKQSYAREWQEARTKLQEHLDQAKSLLDTAEGKSLATQIDSAWKQYQDTHGQAVTSALRADTKTPLITTAQGIGAQTEDQLESLFTELTNRAKADADTSKSAALSALTKKRTAVLFLLACGIALGLTLSTFTARTLSEPMAKTIAMLRELTNGHLGSRLNIHRGDEIGLMASTLDRFADNLQTNVVGAIERIAKGDLSVDVPVADAQDEIGPKLRETIDILRRMILDGQSLTKAAVEGRLDVRGEAAKFHGAYQEIIQGFNNTLDAMGRPIAEILSVMQRIADRDLSARMTGNYQGDFEKIKEAINTAVQNLDEALQQVAVAAEQVATAAEQVQGSSQSLAEGTSEQASSLEEISASLKEMEANAKQSAANAAEVRNLAQDTTRVVETGTESINKLSEAIQKIKTSSESTTKVVKTIDEIAFQTNLLALNAAVEAARAGEAGKGFAVVAEEVRNLAMRSAESAKNTASLIEEAVNNVNEGVRIAEEVTKNFAEIGEQSSRTGVVMSEMAAAIEQQSQSVSQIATAVEQINQVTQQNAANSEETASSSEELASQAEEMRSMLAGFHLSADLTRSASRGSSARKQPRKPSIKETTKLTTSTNAESLIPFGDGENDEVILQNF